MNFLAHLALSGEKEEVILGNYMGDAVKGRLIPRYHGDLLAGLKLHRFIDEFTDRHPINVGARSILREATGKYAGVALDLTYDYLLASNFDNWHTEGLYKFEDRMYSILDKYKHEMPARTQSLYAAMSAGKWLSGYGVAEGFESACRGLGSRIPYKNGLSFVPDVVRKELLPLQSCFNEFYPELQNECDVKLKLWV